jgi:class III poly(R)-hydroxyalkanoic acid synthase PhaE subunit
MAMSDTKGGPDWAGDWQALQRQYWTAWSDLARQQGTEARDPSTPWHEGLEQWSRMFASAGKQTEAAERLMSSAKDYLNLMQSMLAFASGKDMGALNPQSWLDGLRNSFNVPGIDAALFNNPLAKALRDISGQGVRSFEQLATGAVPMLDQLQQEGRSWLQAPAFGYAREHQEHYQKMALAFVDFQEAVKQYNALILKSSQRSFEILEGKLAERSEPGRQIDSIRALYDLWVDAAEEAYAEIALSDEFRKVYGEVVNSQMRVRSQLQQEVERIGVDLGMPTRTELNSVHKRLHDLRRELRASQETQRNAGNEGRDAEIAAMRAEIEDLRRMMVHVEAAMPARPRAIPQPASNKPKPKPKRSAAKRTHVATKSASLAGTKAPPRKRKPVAAVARPAVATKSAAAAPRHEIRSGARTSAKVARAVRNAAPVVSFSDAIAAVRRKLDRNGPKAASSNLRDARPGRSKA